MNPILTVMSVVLLGMLSMHSGDACYLELGIQGLAVFPSMRKGQDVEEKPVRWWQDKEPGHCMLYTRIKPRHTMRMELGDFDLNGYNMTVYVNKYQKSRTWEKFGVFNDSNKNSLLIITDYRAMKIIVREDAQFRFPYKLLFCQVPEEVVSTVCTSGQFRTSICEFACNIPLYSPLDSSSPTFLAKCRSNRKWTEDFSQKCVSLAKVIDVCFAIDEEDIAETKPVECSYSDDQLSTFFPETDAIAGPSFLPFEIILDIAKTRYRGVYVGFGKQSSRSTGKYGACFDLCLQTGDGLYYKQCDNLLYWRMRQRCRACRYVYKICDKNQIIA